MSDYLRPKQLDVEARRRRGGVCVKLVMGSYPTFVDLKSQGCVGGGGELYRLYITHKQKRNGYHGNWTKIVEYTQLSNARPSQKHLGGCLSSCLAPLLVNISPSLVLHLRPPRLSEPPLSLELCACEEVQRADSQIDGKVQ